MLECGAKVDSKIKSDITPLHLGAQKGYQEIIETILKFVLILTLEMSMAEQHFTSLLKKDM
ncbi:MAG: hypothetical protein ACEY3F_02355 [Wolbachia sp.]